MSTKQKKKTTAKSAAKKAVKKAAKKVAKKAAKKATTKKTAKTVKASKTKKTTAASSGKDIEVEEKTKEIVLNARKRNSTPALFKNRKSKNTPVVFTMEDVQSILVSREKAKAEEEAEAKKSKKAKKAATKAAPAPKKKVVDQELPVEHRNHAAASLADILGFNPAEKKSPLNQEDKVPRKHMKYYKALLELRDHVSSELDLHTADTLKRSNKDDSGDLSGYGQHMADAGTDTFDRDFALSLVSNEQEALNEIEEAIQRIFDGSYGVCEITNEPINKERLEAVPFTRYSLEGQKELERNNRGKVKRQGGGVFGDVGDDAVSFGEDGDDN